MVSLTSHYTRIGGGPIGGAGYLAVTPQIRKIINEEFHEVGEAALGEAQGFIDIAGTNNIWSGWFGDRSGGARDRSGASRSHTGAMKKALDFRVFAGASDFGLDVGWIHPGTYEDYMGEQEHGFTHGGYRGPHSAVVAGMGMFQHLRVYLRGKVDEAADRAMDRITSGL